MRTTATTPAEPAGASVARFPANGSLPRIRAGSASASPFSRPAQRSLRVAARMVADPPKGAFYLECFEQCRYLHHPLQLLPAGATVAGRDLHPLGNGAFPRRTRTVWLPWRGDNGHDGSDCRMLSATQLPAYMAISASLHPAWERCSPAVRKLHARNVAILLGERWARPVNACNCWTAQGRPVGGTGMAIRIAEARGIPVLNLGSMAQRAVCERLPHIHRAGSGAWRRRGAPVGRMPGRAEGVRQANWCQCSR